MKEKDNSLGSTPCLAQNKYIEPICRIRDARVLGLIELLTALLFSLQPACATSRREVVSAVLLGGYQPYVRTCFSEIKISLFHVLRSIMYYVVRTTLHPMKD